MVVRPPAMTPYRQVRATFDARTITLYQAFCPGIADAAVAAQRFVAPFSLERMTWVKPSFLWMMERCGWATKPNQERVLAVQLPRERFDALLAQAVPTTFEPGFGDVDAWRAALVRSAVRVQWDPERGLRGEKLAHRALQLGIGRPLAAEYATAWVSRITDVTPLVKRLAALRREGAWQRAARLLPAERRYAG